MVSAVNFLTGILLARFLGLEEYGRFTLAWMVVLLFNSFQHSSIIAPMMSIGPKQEEQIKSAYYCTVFIHQLICSACCAILLWIGVFLSGFIKPYWHIQDLAFPLATTLFTWQLQDFIRRYFFVLGKSALAFMNDSVSYLGQIIVLLFLFRFYQLQTPQILWIISLTSSLAVFIFAFKIKNISFSFEIFHKTTIRHWSFSKWMLASSLMDWTSGNIFFIMAGSILDTAAVGGIKAAQNIIGVFHIIFGATDILIYSGASNSLHVGGISNLKKYLFTFIFRSSFISILIATFLYLSADYIFSIIYGDTFLNYAFLLRWFCAIYIIIFISYPLVAGLRALENTRVLFFTRLSTFIFSLLSANSLVKTWELSGAMFGFLIVNLIKFVILFACLLYSISIFKTSDFDSQ